MHRILNVIALLLVAAHALRADVVTAGAIINLLSPTVGVTFATSSVGRAPSGQAMVAYVRGSTTGTTTLSVAFYSATGSLISGPTTLSLPSGRAPSTCVVGASPTGFCLVYDATATGSTGRDIYASSYSLSGTLLGSLTVNSLTDRDEARPSVDGFSNGSFAISWVRRAIVGGALSEGVYVRRITSAAAAIDPIEVRVDEPTQNIGNQDATAIACWPSGRMVVVWMDGTNGTPNTAPSPDGHGQAILARMLASPITPSGSQFVVNSITAEDQFEPNVAADDRNSCIIGWCGDTNPSLVDAYARRFTDLGSPIDGADINITPTINTVSQFLMSAAMTSNGEAIVTWMDGGVTPGQPGQRTSFARLSQQGSIIESQFIEPASGGTEAHRFPKVGCDQYGNFLIAHQVDVTVAGSTSVGLRTRNYKRNMLVPGNSTPPVGGGLSFTIDSPSDAGNVFVLAASAGQGPSPVDTRSIRLSYDDLFLISVFQGGAGVFFNFAGTLNSSGISTLPGVLIPNLPSLSGASVYFAFATGLGGAPSGINTISDTAAITIL